MLSVVERQGLTIIVLIIRLGSELGLLNPTELNPLGQVLQVG